MPRRPSWTPLRSVGMGTRQLLAYPRSKPDWIEYQIELHRRFALPVACLMLAMVGIPLGHRHAQGRARRRVRQRHLRGVLLLLPGVCFAARAGAPADAAGAGGAVAAQRRVLRGGADFSGAPGKAGRHAISSAICARAWADFFEAARRPGGGYRALRLSPAGGCRCCRSWWIPTSSRLSSLYLVLMLSSFVSLMLICNFFELIGDMLRNNISLWKMFTYLFFLSPQLIYELLPISVLVAVLAAFGVMSKQNEITAFKACGVSLFRLAAPILMGSDAAERRVVRLRLLLRGRRQPQAGRPARRDQGPRHPDLSQARTASGSWAYNSSRIFNYKYFDNSGEESSMNEASVFELEPKTFRLMRQIYARRARWSVPLKTWVFEDGWSCEYKGAFCHVYTPFQATTFRELTEPPDYFLKEALQDKQMNFLQLDRYITGPDAERLRRHGQAAGAALPQVLGAAVRPDDGDDRDPVRLPGGQSRRHGGRGPEHRDRRRLSRASASYSRSWATPASWARWWRPGVRTWSSLWPGRICCCACGVNLQLLFTKCGTATRDVNSSTKAAVCRRRRGLAKFHRLRVYEGTAACCSEGESCPKLRRAMIAF